MPAHCCRPWPCVSTRQVEDDGALLYRCQYYCHCHCCHPQGIASMAMGTCTNISSQDWSDAPFTTILTNGKGFVQDPATRKPVGAPYVLKVQKGKRYRVRTIQGASSWGLKVKAPQGHGMTVIALDGSNVQATPGKGFVFTPGERVDFILHANQVCVVVAVGGGAGAGAGAGADVKHCCSRSTAKPKAGHDSNRPVVVNSQCMCHLFAAIISACSTTRGSPSLLLSCCVVVSPVDAVQSVGNYWMDIATLTGNNSPVLVSYVGAEARTASSPRLSLGCEWALYEPGEWQWVGTQTVTACVLERVSRGASRVVQAWQYVDRVCSICTNQSCMLHSLSAVVVGLQVC